MEIEAPSMPTIIGPAVSPGFSSFAGPEISAGGSASITSEIAPSGGFQSVLDFGSVHQVSGDIFSQDKAVSCPESIFNEGLFETLAKPQISPEPSSPSEIFGPFHRVSEADFSQDKTIAQPETIFRQKNKERSDAIFQESFWENLVKPMGTTIKPSSPSEIVGPEIAAIETPVSGGLVSQEEPGFLVTEESFITSVTPRGKKPKENEINEKPASGEKTSFEIFLGGTAQTIASEAEKKEEEITDLVNEIEAVPEKELPQSNILPRRDDLEQAEPMSVETSYPLPQEELVTVEEKTARQLIKGKAEPETENETQKEVVAETQLSTSDENRGGGRVKVSEEENDQTEPSDEPKEPLWKISGKKEGEEKIDEKVLERRIKAAKDIILEGAQETVPGETGDYWFVSNVVKRLGKLDAPSVMEMVRITLGKLTMPSVAGEAQKELFSLKPGERNPEGVFKTLSETLLKKPPLQHKGGKMENVGLSTQSGLEKLSEQAAVLAKEGATHIVYNSSSGKWERVEKKPSLYPVELDKTKKNVPVRNGNKSIDTKKSLWYTLFAQRAQARANRRKAIS